MKNYECKGQIQYKGNWVIVKVPESVTLYYRSIVRLMTFGHIKLTRPLHGSHITVIAGKYDDVSDSPKWKFNDGLNIKIKYSNIIYRGEDSRGGYYWLKVLDSDILRETRKTFGLSETPFWDYHLTIGYIDPESGKKKIDKKK